MRLSPQEKLEALKLIGKMPKDSEDKWKVKEDG